MDWIRLAWGITCAAIALVAGYIGVTGAWNESPRHAGIGSVVALVSIAAHPWIARTADGRSRVLRRSVPVLAAACAGLHAWGQWRRQSLTDWEVLRNADDASWYRPLFAADLLAAGCLILAAVCAGASAARSERRPPWVVITALGTILLAGAGWRAVAIAAQTGMSLRSAEETATRIADGVLIVNAYRFETDGSDDDPGSAILIGALLLGAALTASADATPPPRAPTGESADARSAAE